MSVTIDTHELEVLGSDPWAITPEFYTWIRNRFEPHSRLLVFGNGQGTRILSKYYQVVCVEHDPNFMDPAGCEAILPAPLEDGTYAAAVLQNLDNHGPFHLVIIDGPPGHLCDRSLLLKYFPSFWRRGTQVAIDDTHRPQEAVLVELVKARYPCMSESVPAGYRATVVVWPCDHFLNEIADTTVVVSLPKRCDRREHIRTHFGELGIRFRFFDAIRPTAAEVSWREMRHLEAYGYAENLRSDYVLGAVGCKRSAIAVLQEFVHSPASTCLMIQDDQDTSSPDSFVRC